MRTLTRECREPEMLSRLGRELRAGAETLPRRLAVLLAAYAAANIVAGGETPCVYVGDEKSLEALEEMLAERGVAERVVLVRDPSACRGLPAIILWARSPPQGLDYRLVVAQGVKPSKLGLARVTVKPLPRGGYRLRIGRFEALVEEREGRLCELETPAARVAELLAEAIREYGPLRVSEAVQLLASALGVTRSEARRLLYEAAAEGLVSIEDGYVTRASGGRAASSSHET